jgi:acyl-CoA synthetase (AMP-forming)/AMP-acid ligase II
MVLNDNTLVDLFARNAREHGDRSALLINHERLTHGAFHVATERLALGLAAASLRRGDRVAILAGNRPEVLLLLGAVARLGAILVPINTRMSAHEAGHVLSDAAPVVLVAESAFMPMADAFCGHRYALGAAPSGWLPFADLTLSPAAPLPDVASAGDGVLMIYTAAVSGQQRGALLSQRNLVAASQDLGQRLQLGPNDVLLGALPLYHVAGIGFALACQLAGGATLLLERFDAPTAVRAIDSQRVTLCVTFSPMLAALLDAALVSGTTLSSLRVVSGLEAGDTIVRLEAQSPQVRFWSGYGQTEISSVVCIAPYRERPGAAGRAAPPNEVAVADEAGQLLPPGQTGEIVVRGPTVFLGWWDAGTRRAIAPPGDWHHTGDLGRLDEQGYLWYAGRAPHKALIKSGGENVYPEEVELALLAHPAVAAAVVFGVPDSHWGEAVRAVCVKQPQQEVGADELIEFVASRIARFKRPRDLVFVERLPTLPDGTTNRAAVAQAHGEPGTVARFDS